MSTDAREPTWRGPCAGLADEDDDHVDDVQVHLLGRFQVHRDGREVRATAFGGRKVRALLRVLAVRRPGLVPHDVLAEALWPDHLPADPAGNLNVLVNRARRAVGDPGIVVTGVGGYALGPCRLDVEAFSPALGAARQAASAGNSLAALADAEAALAMWAEPLAEDVYADWALEPRRRLLGEHIEALELAAAAALAIGGTATAAGYAAEAVAAEPLRESLVLLLARALAARGDRAAALARLAELRRLLADELGVDPSPETEELQLRLLRGEPVAPVAAPPTPVRAPMPAPRTGGAAPMRFVGREAEVAAVRAQLAEGGIAGVGGVAGAGKSRLVAEALRSSTLPEITGRAFQPERAEAWGLARSVLREALAVDAKVGETLPDRVRDALTELLPELAAATPAPLDGESRRALVLAGGLRILEAASASGAVLVADDLQWADPSSLLLLTSALARLPQLRAVLVFRSDELPAGALAPLREVRDVVDVPVGPLPPDAVTALAGDAALAGALLAATDGTPFAVSEVLRELATRGAVEAGPGGGWRAVGPQAVELAADLGRDGQRRAVRRRVARHAAGDDVLPLVALLAREVPARIVAEAAGLPERAVLDRLSELAGADLLRLGEQGWATAHDLVGETVVADLSPPERGRLHGLLARALESGDADASEIAGHHRGAGDATAAADWYARAARTALDGQATREAAALASTGLDLRPRPPARAALLDVRADARSARGDLPGAQEDLHEALRAQPGTGRARRLARLAMTTFGAQDPRHAAELAEM